MGWILVLFVNVCVHRMGRNLLFWVSALASLRVLTYGAEYDFTVEVDGGKNQCYYQPVLDPTHVTMEIDYQVIEGGDLDISLRISDPVGRLLAIDVRRMDNTRRINITDTKGDYEICFDNSFCAQKKVVFFQLLLEDETGNSDDLEYDKLASNLATEIQEAMDKIRETCITIKTNLNRAETSQAVLRALEARDRAVMESNQSRVTFWSIFNSGMMVALGFLQVFMVKTLFNDNSAIGKVIRGSKT